MMQPENWIKRRVRNETHMTSSSPHVGMNCIMYRLQAAIHVDTVINIVRKWPIIGLLGKELIGLSVQPATD